MTAEKDRKIDEQFSSPGSPSSVGDGRGVRFGSSFFFFFFLLSSFFPPPNVYNSTTASTAAPDSDKKLQSSLEREKQLRAKIENLQNNLGFVLQRNRTPLGVNWQKCNMR